MFSCQSCSPTFITPNIAAPALEIFSVGTVNFIELSNATLVSELDQETKSKMISIYGYRSGNL